MSTYKNTELTANEMKRLDDGQEWYKAGDEVYVGGYVDDSGSGTLDLSVNGETHDNWTKAADLPASIRARLS